MTDVAANVHGPLDQVGGLTNDLAEITAAYQTRLACLTDDTRDVLVQALGLRLIDVFVPDPNPTPPKESE